MLRHFSRLFPAGRNAGRFQTFSGLNPGGSFSFFGGWHPGKLLFGFPFIPCGYHLPSATADTPINRRCHYKDQILNGLL
jgi:hypothetical protein